MFVVAQANLIKICWHNNPDVRPACERVLLMLEDIALDYCTNRASYDACVAKKKDV